MRGELVIVCVIFDRYCKVDVDLKLYGEMVRIGVLVYVGFTNRKKANLRIDSIKMSCRFAPFTIIYNAIFDIFYFVQAILIDQINVRLKFNEMKFYLVSELGHMH